MRDFYLAMGIAVGCLGVLALIDIQEELARLRASMHAISEEHLIEVRGARMELLEKRRPAKKCNSDESLTS